MSADTTVSDVNPCDVDWTPSRIQVGLGRLKEPPRGGSGTDAGRRLAENCLTHIDCELFPPKLFTVWLTSALQPYAEVLAGICDTLRERGLGDVPVIGTSVAACWSEAQIHERGGLLIGLASRWLNVTAALVEDAERHPQRAAKRLLQALSDDGISDINPRGNRFLMMYQPGYDPSDATRYCGPEIVDEINRLTYGRLHLFGGVSCENVQSELGWQFYNRQVVQRGLCGALVESDIAYGIGLNHGLVSTGEHLHVKEVAADGRTILQFDEGAARDVAGAETDSPLFLGQHSSSERDTVLVPQWCDEGLRTHTTVEVGDKMIRMRPDNRRMQKSVLELEKWVHDALRVEREQIACVMAVACVGRYRKRESVGFELDVALEKAQERFRNGIHVGCFLEGEVGLDWLGRSRFGNWSVSELLLGDESLPVSQFSRGFNALADSMRDAMLAPTEKDAIAVTLQQVEAAGFRGGMVSLVLDNADRRWAVAVDAFGPGWKEHVLPRTVRRVDGNDCLASLVRNKRHRFFADARKEPTCDPVAVEAGNVISFYAAPLMDELGRVIGILQVDLGDMRGKKRLPDHTRSVLEMLTTSAEFSLNHSIRAEELRLVRSLDAIMDESIARDTVDEAVAYFVECAAQELGTDAHIRLCNKRKTQLRLVGGVGAYYECARQGRRQIDIVNDQSPTATTFRRAQRLFVNNSDADPVAKTIRDQLPEASPLGQAVRGHLSFADFPVRESDNDEPAGVACFCSNQKWFFTESKLRSLRDTGQRLFHIMSHVREKEVKRQTIADLEFLRQITPPGPSDSSIYEALRQQAEQIRQASNADVVSCFLWCTLQERFVLRAQAGWEHPEWLDAAWFDQGEGLSGRVALRRVPLYVSDRFKTKIDGKYIWAMFDDLSPEDETLEMIGLPLLVKEGPLGILTMYRRRSVDEELTQSGFATTDRETLRVAAGALSGYVASMTEAERNQWYKKEEAKLRSVTETLRTGLENGRLDAMLDAAAERIRNRYGARVCTIYLADADKRWLNRAASSQRQGLNEAVANRVAGGELWLAFVQREARSIRRPVTDVNDPELVRQDNLIERVALPLISEGRCLGVLELRWRGSLTVTSGVLPFHDQSLLEALGEELAAAISKCQMQDREDRAQQGLSGLAQYLAASFHRMKSEVKELEQGFGLLTNDTEKPAGERQRIRRLCQSAVDSMKDRLSKAELRGRLLTTFRPEPHAPFDILSRLVSTWPHSSDKEFSLHLILRTQELKTEQLIIDADQIEQVFRALIENSVRHVPDEGWIEVRMDRDDEREELVVRCEDSGLGLSRERFLAFTSGPAVEQENLAEQAAGNGVGLFMARLFCEAHGGRLELECDGPTPVFRVSLPIRKA